MRAKATPTISLQPATRGPPRTHQRASGGDDVVDQHCPPRHRSRPGAHAAGRPGATLPAPAPHLRRRRSRPLEAVFQRQPRPSRKRSGELVRLVEPSSRCRPGWSGTGTSAAPPRSGPVARSRRSALPSRRRAPRARNLSARTSARAGPSSPTGAQMLTPPIRTGAAAAPQQPPATEAERLAPAGRAAAGPTQGWYEHAPDHYAIRVTRGHPTATISRQVDQPQLYSAARPRRAGAARAVRGHLRIALSRGARRGRRARRGLKEALAFTGAAITILIALVSPIDRLGKGYLFSAHMLQHVLLGDIAPLLLLLALSRVIMRPATRRPWAWSRRSDRSPIQ